MRFFKKILFFLVLLLVAVFVFYFWAKSPMMSDDEYAKLYHFPNIETIKIKDTFSIMTYNMGYLSGMTNNLAVERPKKLIQENLLHLSQLITEKQPNIIAWQEIDFSSTRSYHINQMEEIAYRNEYSYAAKAVNWDKKYVPFPYWPIKYHFGEMQSGQAILSKVKMFSHSRIVLPKPESDPFYYQAFYLDRLAQLVWVETERDSMLLINVHLEAYDALTREKQAFLLLDIYQKYEQNYPIILLGDFNCTPPFDKNAFAEETIKLFDDYSGMLMATTMDDYLVNPEVHFTFDSREPYQKIDYIFYNPKFLKCLGVEVVHSAKEISDHLPLYAHFEFVEE